MKTRTLWLLGGGAALLLLVSSRANAATAGASGGASTGGGIFSGLSGGGSTGSSTGTATTAAGPATGTATNSLEALIGSIAGAMSGLVSATTSAITGIVDATKTSTATTTGGATTTTTTAPLSVDQIAGYMTQGLAATPGSTLEQVVQKAVNSYGVAPSDALAAALKVTVPVTVPVYDTVTFEQVASTRQDAASVERIAQAMREGLAQTSGSTIDQVIERAVSVYNVPRDIAMAAASLV